MLETTSLSVTSATTAIAFPPPAVISATACSDFSVLPYDGNRGAGRDEASRHAEADAAIAARDDGDLAAKIEQL